MRTYQFGQEPISNPPSNSLKTILREWELCNYEMFFAPHRVAQALDNICTDIQAVSHYLPPEDDPEANRFHQYLRSQHGEEHDAHKLLNKAWVYALELNRFYKQALSTIPAFAVTLDREIEFCERYISSRILTKYPKRIFRHYTTTDETLYSPDLPELIPSFLIYPWYSVLLRNATNFEETVLSLHLERHPTVDNAILCSINTVNIPFQINTDASNADERTLWRILNDRSKQCALLGLPYSLRAEGAIIDVGEDLSILKIISPNEEPSVNIELTIPIITPLLCHFFSLTGYYIDTGGYGSLADLCNKYEIPVQ